MKYVAFVPLRGGSKSIPRKNIRPIAGKPLCHWTVGAALGSTHIERVFVATDSPEIEEVVGGLGHPKLEVIGRSPETATDTASTESAMLEFAEGRKFDHVVLIQATSPLLRSADLDAAIETFERLQADSLVSVVAQRRFIWSVEEGGGATAQNYDPAARPRRQDFAPYHVENGAFYISERRGLLRTKSRLFGQIVAHVMPEETFHELDEPVDFEIIEGFLRARATAGTSSAHRPLGESSLGKRAQQIRLVLTDVDGVLTDAGMYYSERGDELKKFSTRDGKGFELLREAGLKVGIITSEDTEIVARRAAKLGADILYQGARDKVPAFDEILRDTGLRPEQIAYLGDDLADLPVLSRVGLAACPADATREAKEASHLVCDRGGGAGCFRELAELILRHRSAGA